MKRSLTLILSAIVAVTALSGAASPYQQNDTSAAAEQGTLPVTACENLGKQELPEVTKISAGLVTGGEAADQKDLPSFCRVALTVEPQINIEVWLPTETYNGRFQAVGNGGMAGSISFPDMADALRDGYATASTDTGHTGRSGSFGLSPDGSPDWQLIEDFASRSLIELTEKAKTTINTFYGQTAQYSYWNGCSTGGRQGLMLAQRYPEAYDGILAGAPAINWDRFLPAALWPLVVMQEENGGMLGACKFEKARQAATAHCDPQDGVIDGVLTDPRICDFNVQSLVGEPTPCGDFTVQDALAIDKIWTGPTNTEGKQLWYGFSPSAELSGRANGQPTPTADGYSRFWLERNPNWDWKTLNYENFEHFFAKSQTMFNEVIGTDDPDLTELQNSGGKLIAWHGWEDRLINPEGTTDYWDRVVTTLPGNANKVGEFARLFMIPGVDHCGGGTDPQGNVQLDMFNSLVSWVEKDQAPENLTTTQWSGQTTATRPLCAYPYVARYDRRGNPAEASSFSCKPNLGQWPNTEPRD
jgi:pimeloyl-ACP methyl ester carboxylesterase